MKPSLRRWIIIHCLINEQGVILSLRLEIQTGTTEEFEGALKEQHNFTQNRSVCRKSVLLSNVLWVSTCLKICCMSWWEKILDFLNWRVFAHPEGGQGEAPAAAAAPPSGGWNRGSGVPAGWAWAVSFLGMVTDSRCRDAVAIGSLLCLVNLCLTTKMVSCVMVK